MSIGLAGAHRTGKSTLAKLYAERQKIPFVGTSSTEVFKALGYDPKADYDFATRLYLQRKILDDMNDKFSQQREEFITDRTPIDALAYTLADVTRENVNGELASEIEAYSKDCFEVLTRHFGIVFLVQPGIQLVEAEGKAPANSAYVEHIAALCFGLLVGREIGIRHFYIPRHMTDLEERYDAMMRSYKQVREDLAFKIATGDICVH